MASAAISAMSVLTTERVNSSRSTTCRPSRRLVMVYGRLAASLSVPLKPLIASLSSST